MVKGLILSGGFGTRLRPITYSQQKQLIPIANKPVLFYAIEDLIEAGINKICIIVGPKKEQVIEVVTSKNWEATIKFIQQEAPKGLAHAVKISEDFIENDSFVMYLGDNILKKGIVDYVKKFRKEKPTASILLTEVRNPQQFGVAQLDDSGAVVRLIEKPKTPPSNLALVGIYMFHTPIFEAVNHIKPSWRNQLEITDAIQYLIDNNYRVDATIVEGWWKDTGKPEDILDANRLVLDDITTEIYGSIKDDVHVKGRVRIGNSRIEGNSVLKGPLIIGDNCIIRDSYIGPYTSLGNNCKIINTEIEDSIIMDETKIENCGRIVDSLIGKDVKLKKNSKLPEGYRLVIGDHSEVEL